MMRQQRYRNPGGLWLLGLIVALVMSGCDSTTTSETVTLQPKTITFEFPQFSADDAQGGTLQINSLNQEDLESELRADGFSRGEVVQATITRVELERRSVGSAAESAAPKVFGFLVSGEAQLTQGGTTQTVAERDAFDPNAAVTPMSITTGNATSFVSASSPFGARLDLDVENIGVGPYRVALNITFRIEVEGV